MQIMYHNFTVPYKKYIIIPLCVWCIFSSQFFGKMLNSSIYVQRAYNQFTLFCKVLDNPPSGCQKLSPMWIPKRVTLQQ